MMSAAPTKAASTTVNSSKNSVSSSLDAEEEGDQVQFEESFLVPSFHQSPDQSQQHANKSNNNTMQSSASSVGELLARYRASPAQRRSGGAEVSGEPGQDLLFWLKKKQIELDDTNNGDIMGQSIDARHLAEALSPTAFQVQRSSVVVEESPVQINQHVIGSNNTNSDKSSRARGNHLHPVIHSNVPSVSNSTSTPLQTQQFNISHSIDLAASQVLIDSPPITSKASSQHKSPDPAMNLLDTADFSGSQLLSSQRLSNSKPSHNINPMISLEDSTESLIAILNRKKPNTENSQIPVQEVADSAPVSTITSLVGQALGTVSPAASAPASLTDSRSSLLSTQERASRISSFLSRYPDNSRNLTNLAESLANLSTATGQTEFGDVLDESLILSAAHQSLNFEESFVSNLNATTDSAGHPSHSQSVETLARQSAQRSQNDSHSGGPAVHISSDNYQRSPAGRVVTDHTKSSVVALPVLYQQQQIESNSRQSSKNNTNITNSLAQSVDFSLTASSLSSTQFSAVAKSLSRVCSMCDSSALAYNCARCEMKLCRQCNEDIHAPNKIFPNHPVTEIAAQQAKESQSAASVAAPSESAPPVGLIHQSSLERKVEVHLQAFPTMNPTTPSNSITNRLASARVQNVAQHQQEETSTSKNEQVVELHRQVELASARKHQQLDAVLHSEGQISARKQAALRVTTITPSPAASPLNNRMKQLHLADKSQSIHSGVEASTPTAQQPAPQHHHNQSGSSIASSRSSVTSAGSEINEADLPANITTLAAVAEPANQGPTAGDIVRQLCDLCADEYAAYYCSDCELYLCGDNGNLCESKLHNSSTANRAHKRRELQIFSRQPSAAVPQLDLKFSHAATMPVNNLSNSANIVTQASGNQLNNDAHNKIVSHSGSKELQALLGLEQQATASQSARVAAVEKSESSLLAQHHKNLAVSLDVAQQTSSFSSGISSLPTNASLNDFKHNSSLYNSNEQRSAAASKPKVLRDFADTDAELPAISLTESTSPDIPQHHNNNRPGGSPAVMAPSLFANSIRFSVSGFEFPSIPLSQQLQSDINQINAQISNRITSSAPAQATQETQTTKIDFSAIKSEIDEAMKQHINQLESFYIALDQRMQKDQQRLNTLSFTAQSISKILHQAEAVKASRVAQSTQTDSLLPIDQVTQTTSTRSTDQINQTEPISVSVDSSLQTDPIEVPSSPVKQEQTAVAIESLSAQLAAAQQLLQSLVSQQAKLSRLSEQAEEIPKEKKSKENPPIHVILSKYIQPASSGSAYSDIPATDYASGSRVSSAAGGVCLNLSNGAAARLLQSFK
jgi:hypothetical protein